MSIYLGDKIKEMGGTIKLDCKVRKVIQDEHKVVVINQDGQ